MPDGTTNCLTHPGNERESGRGCSIIIPFPGMVPVISLGPASRMPPLPLPRSTARTIMQTVADTDVHNLSLTSPRRSDNSCVSVEGKGYLASSWYPGSLGLSSPNSGFLISNPKFPMRVLLDSNLLVANQRQNSSPGSACIRI